MITQIVLITGALTGIGRATAFPFAKEGSRIVISGRHEDEGRKLVSQLRKLGTEAAFERCDVRYEEDLRSLVAAANTRPPALSGRTASSSRNR